MPQLDISRGEGGLVINESWEAWLSRTLLHAVQMSSKEHVNKILVKKNKKNIWSYLAFLNMISCALRRKWVHKFTERAYAYMKHAAVRCLHIAGQSENLMLHFSQETGRVEVSPVASLMRVWHLQCHCLTARPASASFILTCMALAERTENTTEPHQNLNATPHPTWKQIPFAVCRCQSPIAGNGTQANLVKHSPCSIYNGSVSSVAFNWFV